MVSIKKIKQENKLRLSRAYLAMEVERKTAHICKQYSIKYCAYPEGIVFTHWPDVKETRSLTRLVWETFEAIDEILNLTNIGIYQYDDAQSMDIMGQYNKQIQVRLEVYYSTLNTCKVEMVDTVVKKAKLTCI